MDQITEHERAEYRRFAKLLTWASVLAFVLISLGSLVRASHSGLSCPDWPLCYGKAVPTFDTHIFLEWFHRLIAGSLGMLMLVGTLKLLRRPLLRRAFGLQIAVSAVLLMIQVVLGGLTVLKLLDPTTVSAHLLNALLFFSVLVWMAVRARALSQSGLVSAAAFLPDSVAPPTWVRWGFLAATILLFLQIGVGGSVSSRFAGLACPDFPTCYGSGWAMPASLPQALQMVHREIAFVLLAFTTALAVLSARLRLPPAAKRAARLVPLLLGVQIGLGVVNIFYGLPIWASVSHLANAASIYTLLLLASIALFLPSRGKYQGATDEHPRDHARAQRGLAQLSTTN